MTKPYADMSYDELNAYVESSAIPAVSICDVLDEMEHKSAVMTAICKLAAELDSEGWRLVPRLMTAEMQRAMWDEYANGEGGMTDAFHRAVDAAPPLDQRETA